MFRLIPVVAACALCPPAAAQTIYKCTVDGKVSYADRPCPGGASIAVAAPAARPDTSVPAREAARRERETLLQMEKLRMTRELQMEKLRLARELQAERKQARAQKEADAQRRKCEKLRLQRKWAIEDAFRASGPAREAARRKARRDAEALAVECPA